MQLIVFLGLLLVGGQVKAQQATKVNVINEDFERPEFSGNYIDPNREYGVTMISRMLPLYLWPMMPENVSLLKIQTLLVTVNLHNGHIPIIPQEPDIIFLP